jgi:hypothetical protein
LETGRGGDSLFILNDGIFAMAITQVSIPEEPFIAEVNDRNFEYFAIDPETGDIFASDPLDFVSQGHVYHFSSGGKLINTLMEVGIVPGSFGFNH